jgi:hypothetical protein
MCACLQLQLQQNHASRQMRPLLYLSKNQTLPSRKRNGYSAGVKYASLLWMLFSFAVHSTPVTCGCSRQTLETEEGACKCIFKLHFTGGEDFIIAASGERKTAKGHWKYCSHEAFVNADGKPWSQHALKGFKNASARTGVIAWLLWLIQHTPKPENPSTVPEPEDAIKASEPEDDSKTPEQ